MLHFRRPGTSLLLVAKLLTIVALAQTAWADSILRFAPLPLEDRKILHEQFHGLMAYLSRQTNRQIEMVYLDDYANILDSFRNNQIDLAYLGPLPYVILKKDFAAAEPVVCFRDVNGMPDYTCSLVAFGDDDLQLDKLKGLRFGLTQPYSTCGYLAVSEMLRQQGLSLHRDGNSFRYAGSHSKAALGVARGEFDVAGVKTAIAKRYLHLDLHILEESHRFPGFALVANRNNLDEQTIATLRAALLALDPTQNPADRNRTRSWGKHLRNGAGPPAACNYDGVAEALQHTPWPIPGAQ